MASIIALVSGVLMSIQGVWNTRLRESIGIWCTNSFVQGTGFLFALIILLFVRDANLTGFKSVNKFYLLSGIIGVGIVYTVIISISQLGPPQATLLILIAQITMSYLIQLFGWFGEEKSPFQWTKLLGVGIMILGIFIFQWKK